MVTFSLCMIVKNEELMLAECLNSLKDLMDEMIIVDTGSTDATKQVAHAFTKHVYDFAWTGSFSDARNFAFSQATCDYIYSADADELLDEENQRRLLVLKKNLETAPEIELVQMYYVNQMSNGSVYNFDKEYRPKLFKRLRTFRWADPIHEQVVTLPLVFDSDIEIIHRQKESHADRDLLAFERVIAAGEPLCERLQHMYAMECYKAGADKHLALAREYFVQYMEKPDISKEQFTEAGVIVALAALRSGEKLEFLKYAMRLVAMEPCSEICLLLGSFYEARADLKEAKMWYYNAAYETKPVLDLASGEELPREALTRIGDLS